MSNLVSVVELYCHRGSAFFDYVGAGGVPANKRQTPDR